MRRAKKCEHPPLDTFVRTVDGARVWKCSVCASETTWSPEHRTYGKIECPCCWGDDVRFVVCSDLCSETARAMGFET